MDILEGRNVKKKAQASKASKGTSYLVLAIFLIAMLLIHRDIFLYADDLYYSRDAASLGLGNLPHFMLKELNINGRVWIGQLMMVILNYDIYGFRLFNPIVLTLTVYLIAKIGTFNTVNNKRKKDQPFLVAIVCSSLFFLFLPIDITNTTIYYAACSFNYLYPTALVMLYAYLLNKHHPSTNNTSPVNYWILWLAFFVGASTQQAGMIGIGFTVLFILYNKFLNRQSSSKGLTSYLIVLFIGYSFVTYGSIKRLLNEERAGYVVDLKDILTELLKTNIFSIPVAGYVLLLSLCCIFWLFHYTYINNKELGIGQIVAGKILGVTLSLTVLGYIYIVFYKKIDLELFIIGGTANPLLSRSFIAFTVIYLISILYVSLLILQKERYPFLLFSSINSIGAQLMLLVVDARFAEAYKVMFPSLLLMSVFLVYSFIKFYRNKVFLSLAVLLIALSLTSLENVFHYTNTAQMAIFILITLTLWISYRSYGSDYFRNSLVALGVVFAVLVFGTTYNGYRTASYAQSFNLKAIKDYQQSSDKDTLWLKKVPKTIYGYNVGNWNDMPYFMKQAYNIDENTVIHYYSR